MSKDDFQLDLDTLDPVTDAEFKQFVKKDVFKFLLDHELLEIQVKDAHGHKAKMKRKYISVDLVATDITNSKLITEE